MTSTDVGDVTYATVEDFKRFCLPEGMALSYSDEIHQRIHRMLRLASRQCDAYLQGSYATPLTTWTEGWRWAVCLTAFSRLARSLGFGAEEGIRQGRLALQFLSGARGGEVTEDPYIGRACPMLTFPYPESIEETPVP